MTLPAIILTTVTILGLGVLIVFALIGLMAMADFAKFNRRPEDDQPPASWLAKQDRGE